MGDRLQAGKPSWYIASHHPGQLSLAIPPWVGAISTSESWDVNRHTARCTSPVSVVWQWKLVSGWGLMKRRSAPLYGPYGSGRTLRFYGVISPNSCVSTVALPPEPWQRESNKREVVWMKWKWGSMWTEGRNGMIGIPLPDKTSDVPLHLYLIIFKLW